jgi:hypothetical protein
VDGWWWFEIVNALVSLCLSSNSVTQLTKGNKFRQELKKLSANECVRWGPVTTGRYTHTHTHTHTHTQLHATCCFACGHNQPEKPQC